MGLEVRSGLEIGVGFELGEVKGQGSMVRVMVRVN